MSIKSPFLLEMLNTQTGYRNESYGGSGETDLLSVIDFECNELENTDILDFCKTNYNLNSIEEIVYFLTQKLSNPTLNCLWLSTLKGVLDNYHKDDESIQKYCLPQEIIPISDLHDQGALFVFVKHPRFLETEEIIL